ncbi:hypothetical protein KC345_g11594, partial [Hortaea werneckii]
MVFSVLTPLLLTHTSGLYPDCAGDFIPYHKSYWQCIGEYFEKYNPVDGEPDWIKAALSGGVNKKVGEEWQYCSFGFCILGEIIKKVTGVTAEQYIEEQILKPLGMNDTVWELTPELAGRAIIRKERHEQRLNDLINGTQPEISQEEKLWNTVSSTGGGLISTPADLIRFANMLLGMGTLSDTRIIGRKAVEKITTRTLYGVPDYCWGANNSDRSYGIGLDMRRGPAFLYSPTSYCHEGAGACCMVIDPTEQLTAVWFVPFTGDNWTDLVNHLKRNLRICRTVAEVTYKEWSAYRTHSMVSIIVGPVYFMVQYFIWTAVYGGHASLGGISLPQMIRYFGATALIGYLIMDFADWNLSMLVRT